MPASNIDLMPELRQLAHDRFGFFNRVGLAERGEEILGLLRRLAHDVDFFEQQRDRVDRAQTEDDHDAQLDRVELLHQVPDLTSCWPASAACASAPRAIAASRASWLRAGVGATTAAAQLHRRPAAFGQRERRFAARRTASSEFIKTS